MPPVIKKETCTGCGLCTQICCMDVFGPTEMGQCPVIRYPKECWHCRACVMDCPTQSITLRYPLPMMMLARRKEPMEGREAYDSDFA